MVTAIETVTTRKGYNPNKEEIYTLVKFSKQAMKNSANKHWKNEILSVSDEESKWKSSSGVVKKSNNSMLKSINLLLKVLKIVLHNLINAKYFVPNYLYSLGKPIKKQAC